MVLQAFQLEILLSIHQKDQISCHWPCDSAENVLQIFQFKNVCNFEIEKFEIKNIRNSLQCNGFLEIGNTQPVTLSHSF